MPVFGNSHVSNLLPVSLAFRELGCAVIPLLGGDDRHAGKRPALRWSSFQTRLPYPDELSAWFGDDRFSAYGVVCGSVSRLIVLDLDKSSLADSFAQQFPHLMETLVVASGLRGTPHIYWRTDFKVESRAFPGGDLKAEGGYVVGPHSAIAGATWQIASDKPIRSITPAELADVLAFLIPDVKNSLPVLADNSKLEAKSGGAGNCASPDNPLKRPNSASRRSCVGIPTPAPAGSLSPTELVAFYNRRLESGAGRNKALFDAARRARDWGYSESRVLEVLNPVHVGARSSAAHPRESDNARAAEAVRTIRSVYSRPAVTRTAPTQSNMPFDSSIPAVSSGYAMNPAAQTQSNISFDSSIPVPRLLPNAARERLLARSDGAAILRTFEAALLSGISETALITEPELCRCLAHIISRKTIRRALTATYDGDQPIFRLVDSTSSPQTPHTLVDTGVEKLYRQKNALLSLGHEGTKVAHRPPRYFIMPTIKAICAGLGVRMTLSSPLTLTDLSSSRGCRQALHADLLTRRPGVYSQMLLGARLGVTARTIRRYHREMPVHSSKTYEETPVSSGNLHRIPSGADIERMMLNVGGQFLMDSAGDKWPLKREIAAWLLKRGRRVSRMEQKANFYWMPGTLELSVGIPTPASAMPSQSNNTNPVGAHSDQRKSGAPVKRPATSLQPPISQPAPFDFPGYTPITVAGESLLVKTHPSLSCQQLPLFAQEGGLMPRIPANGGLSHQNAGIPLKTPNPRESRRKYHRPLHDGRGERLANRLWATIVDFSLMNARRLVTTYGVDSVEAALKKMLWLQARGKVSNPGGFIVTASRVSWRIQNRKTSLGDTAPRFRAEPRACSRESINAQ